MILFKNRQNKICNCYSGFYKILYAILSKIYNIFAKNIVSIHIYYVIFNLLTINCFILNFFYYLCNKNLSINLLKLLNYLSCNSSFIYIKLIQWFISKEDILNISENNITLIKYVFKNIFEDCNYHDYKYTREILQSELYNILDNTYINRQISKLLNVNKFNSEELFINIQPFSSGSIAQTYEAYYYYNTENIADYDIYNNIPIKDNKKFKKICIKIVHPYLYIQAWWSNIFIKTFLFILSIFKINLFICDLPFEYNSIYKNFMSQCNMKNEYINILEFYYKYLDNDYIVIPQPIYANKNILIMTYEDGKSIKDIQDSDYIKAKIIGILNLFSLNNIFYSKILHCDLHEGNWKIQKYKNFYKLIIYDFGFCSNFDKNDLLIKFFYSWMIKDIDNIINLLFNGIINLNLLNNKNTIKLYLKNSIIKNSLDKELNFIILFKHIIKTSKKFNFNINNDVINIFFSIMLIEKYLKKYSIIKDKKFVEKLKTENDIFNNNKQNCFNSISLCREYNIFDNMIVFYNDFLQIYQNKFKNNFKDKTYLNDNIKTSNYEIIDI